jgi:hypothetical protein
MARVGGLLDPLQHGKDDVLGPFPDFFSAFWAVSASPEVSIH